MCKTKTPQLATAPEQPENPLAIVAEVLNDWLDELAIVQPSVDEMAAAALFGMLGTAGYSIVPNSSLPEVMRVRAPHHIPCGECGACLAHEQCGRLQ